MENKWFHGIGYKFQLCFVTCWRIFAVWKSSFDPVSINKWYGLNCSWILPWTTPNFPFFVKGTSSPNLYLHKKYKWSLQYLLSPRRQRHREISIVPYFVLEMNSFGELMLLSWPFLCCNYSHINKLAGLKQHTENVLRKEV